MQRNHMYLLSLRGHPNRPSHAGWTSSSVIDQIVRQEKLLCLNISQTSHLRTPRSLKSCYHRLDAGFFLASFVSVLFHELVGGFKRFSFSGPSIVVFPWGFHESCHLCHLGLEILVISVFTWDTCIGPYRLPYLNPLSVEHSQGLPFTWSDPSKWAKNRASEPWNEASKFENRRNQWDWKIEFISFTHIIHVWYIYLHLP